MNPGNREDTVRIRVEGKTFHVPRGALLLDCIQFIVRNETPALGRFCWANECGNCEMSVKRQGALLANRLRGCQTPVEEDLELSDLTPDLRYWLHRVLS